MFLWLKSLRGNWDPKLGLNLDIMKEWNNIEELLLEGVLGMLYHPRNLMFQKRGQKEKKKVYYCKHPQIWKPNNSSVLECKKFWAEIPVCSCATARKERKRDLALNDLCAHLLSFFSLTSQGILIDQALQFALAPQKSVKPGLWGSTNMGVNGIITSLVCNTVLSNMVLKEHWGRGKKTKGDFLYCYN